MHQMLVFDFSFEQEAIVADHLLYGTQLVVHHEERRRLHRLAQKQHPGARVISANCNLLEHQWEVMIELEETQ